MILTVLLLAFTGFAAATDLARQKIYNWTTYPGMLLAFLLNAVEPENVGLVDSLAGFFVCGFVMLFCRVFYPVGGGDVKLLAMVGAFMGVQRGLESLLWTCVLGSIAGLAMLIWQVGFLRLMSACWRQVTSLLKFWVRQPLEPQVAAAFKIPLYLAPAAFVAVCLVRFSLLDRLGN